MSTTVQNSPANFSSHYNIPTTQKEVDGAFIASSEEDAYIREEAGKVSIAAGISDKDAMDLLLEKIKEQNMNKGNVANV